MAARITTVTAAANNHRRTAMDHRQPKTGRRRRPLMARPRRPALVWPPRAGKTDGQRRWWMFTSASVVTVVLLVPAAPLVGDRDVGTALAISLASAVGVLSFVTVVRRHPRWSRLVPHAIHDKLTDLLLARAWRTQAAFMLTQACGHGRIVALLKIDVDNLADINERCGRATGNEVLRAVAAVIQQTAGRHALIGRLAGDEFVALFPDLDTTGAVKLAQEIQVRVHHLPASRLLGRVNTVEGLSVSIGVAIAPDDGGDIGQLLLTVDMLLFSAQNDGRNHIRAARPGLKETA